MGVKDILREFVQQLPISGIQVDLTATQRYYTTEDASASLARRLVYANFFLLSKVNRNVTDKFPTRGDLERSFTVHSAVFYENSKLGTGNKSKYRDSGTRLLF
jgi:hypothetical protein